MIVGNKLAKLKFASIFNVTKNIKKILLGIIQMVSFVKTKYFYHYFKSFL